jgi:hypothetical protein
MLKYKRNKGRVQRKSQQDEIEKRRNIINTVGVQGKVTINLVSLLPVF